ncbi:patatin-like phospholipase family protein [Massilia sp. IC2-477]|uniref:patatin-like phospholipase family protein n=1 Tax=Massilia sp. IC2-477 TaxID=2887198 RepID=UPI001D11630A|nr:patatin-like phospholipase family protein [Massilia sp. IC2-477]MCC2955687.1 patatin-like phospholipase family protein [Massilia sp. IC2-477]
MTNKKLSLGLQGGGTYGAFTWGVLDRLLQEERLDINALSGTSAGAINAAVVADGWAHGGGREGARAALARFWRALGLTASFSPLQRTPMDHLAGGYTMSFSPFYQLLEMAGALAGPVHEFPLTVNPLRNFLTANIDFERVRACEELAIFINATNLNTGTGKVWERAELDVQKVMASACLPTVFASVEVDGELYWDGSYTANPPLAPLVESNNAQDLLVVQINPPARTETPRSMADISNRANEVAFNISFVREVNTLLHNHAIQNEEDGEAVTFAPVRLHLISAVDMLRDLSVSSKFNAEPVFLQMLHDRGVAAADAWLAAHLDEIGQRTTMDPTPVFRAMAA